MINKSGEITSLNENEIQEAFNVFPNPVSDQLTISNNTSLSTYKLITMDGKEVLSDELGIGNTSINMTQIPSGIYFLILTGSDQKSKISKVVHL